MFNDSLAAALSKINNAEKCGKKEVLISPYPKLLQKILLILQQKMYLGSNEVITEAKGGTLKVNLLGNLNKIGAIKPRFSVKVEDYEKFEKRYLPAKGMGIILVSTSHGIMTHYDAKEKNIGGRLLAYCY